MAGLWRCILAVVMLMCVYLWDSAEAVGGAKSRPRPQRRPPKKPKITPIDLTQPEQDIDIERMLGTWYLLNTASKCSYLVNHGTKVEPTVITITRTATSNETLSVSTKTRQIKQDPLCTLLSVLFIPGSPPEQNIEIVIGDTDYNSYAIMYYQKQGKITMKLYGKSVDNLSEPLLTKFEELAAKQNLQRAYHFPFPTYSMANFTLIIQNTNSNHISCKLAF
uniref:Complement component 8, gamma polypeptide n=1 Tax=Neolamprologus brichardi TaxID=32507 RepID=A0A3Q4G662_NEOBR